MKYIALNLKSPSQFGVKTRVILLDDIIGIKKGNSDMHIRLKSSNNELYFDGNDAVEMYKYLENELKIEHLDILYTA